MAYDSTAAIQATRKRIRRQIYIIHELRGENLDTALAYRVLHHLLYSLRILRRTRTKRLMAQAATSQRFRESVEAAAPSQGVELKGLEFLVLHASAQTQDHSEQRKIASNDAGNLEEKRTRP